jgi:hypothetical protein
MYNPTHFPDPLVCRIRQVLTSCTLRPISLVTWCVGLDSFWHVQSDPFPWSLGVHQVTREMGRIVHDVRTCLIRHTKGAGKCVGLYRMSEPVSDILHNPIHFPGPLVCRIRQVLTSCTIQHISLVPWCVGLDRFRHPAQSNTFPWSFGVSD